MASVAWSIPPSQSFKLLSRYERELLSEKKVWNRLVAALDGRKRQRQFLLHFAWNRVGYRSLAWVEQQLRSVFDAEEREQVLQPKRTPVIWSAYEYQVINQYSGSIVHGNLEIILKKFGAPDDRIALNLSGVPAGKRLRTVVGIWEYLRCYMTIGPWFDENGNRTEFKSLFIDKSLKSGELSFFDLVLESRRTLGQERQEGHGVSGTAFLSWLTSYMLFLPAFGMECIQKIDRKKARHRWPDVVQERLDPNGPTNRLIDIEEEYMVQKQQELDDLHERMRKTLPR